MPNSTEGKKFVGFVDCTPKWVDVAMVLAVASANGSSSAREELLRMAAIADAYLESMKKPAQAVDGNLQDSLSNAENPFRK